MFQIEAKIQTGGRGIGQSSGDATKLRDIDTFSGQTLELEEEVNDTDHFNQLRVHTA